eukprot:2830105-Prymnesium_polylepis.1
MGGGVAVVAAVGPVAHQHKATGAPAAACNRGCPATASPHPRVARKSAACAATSRWLGSCTCMSRPVSGGDEGNLPLRAHQG